MARVAATGLVYMQQRYYDPALGVFLSTDPIAPLKGPFNRYWYANANPYRFTDPDGRYICTAGDNCKKIDAAIAAIGEAAKNLPSNTYEQQTVQSVSDFYGAPGEDNGVTISNETDPSRGGGTVTVDGKTSITIDVVAFGKTPDLAAALGHEGDHGAEQRLFGMPQSEEQEMAGETRASTTEALVYKGLGLDSPRGTWTHSGGMNSEAINQEAAQSTALWCQGNPACN